MKKMKKLAMLVLCLGLVGATSACDMDTLTSMIGGLGGSQAEEGSSVESMGEEESAQTSQEEEEQKPEAGVTEEEWQEAIKEEKFNNVTFGYSVLFEGHTEKDTGVAYLDGNRVAFAESGREPELMDEEESEALRNIYIKTTLAVLEKFDSFTYDVTMGAFVSTATIIYDVNVLGTAATITAKNVMVRLDGDGNIAEITCDMQHDYVENGQKGQLVMVANFTFTNYGTTIVPTVDETEKPGGDETPEGGEKPEGGEEEKPEDNESEDGALPMKDAWDQMFAKSYSYENYKMVIESRNDREGNISESFTYYDINSNAVYVSSNGRYYELVDGESFWYFLVDGEWVKEPFDGNMMYGSEMIKANLAEYQKMFEYFTFDEKTNSFYAQNVPYDRNGTTITLYELRVYIENGMVTKVYSDSDILKTYPEVEIIGRSQTTITFSDFGQTMVELPVIKAEQQVTEEEWLAALDLAVNTNNVTVHMNYINDYTDDSRDSVTDSYMKLKENATFQWGEDYQQAYAKENGVDYAYRWTDGAWTKSEMGMEVTYTNYRMSGVIAPLCAIYDDVAYDVEKGVYACTEVMVDAGDGTMMPLYNLEVGFENGELTYFYFEMASVNSDGEKIGYSYVTIELWDYGTTEVELPKVA